ncbi:MAG TPA: transporter substrate-binding domain-containing protein [Acholeplasma sp.]|nr:transporter substrate-binding domain-containing protein [Acholeplasma sp.]
MKKILLITIMLLSFITLAGCSRDETVLRVGMDLKYPPFETLDGDTPEGISVEVAKALGRYLNRKVEIVNTNFISLIPSLQSNEIDVVIASMSITDERKKFVEFSDPYFFFKIISLVNQSFATANGLTEDSTVEDLLAIKDVKYIGLASQVSTTIPASYNKNVIQATSLATAIESISQGTADVLLMSANPVADGYRANKSTTMILWAPFESSPIGMAFNKKDTALVEKANEFIATLSEENGLYNRLKNEFDALIKERLVRYGLEFYINE